MKTLVFLSATLVFRSEPVVDISCLPSARSFGMQKQAVSQPFLQNDDVKAHNDTAAILTM